MTSVSFEPKDADARRRICESLDETLLVEAGAGTGKTHSLVSRVVELVAGGKATMDRVAAITFTEAAAAELRDRIREALERRAAEAGSEEERQRCEKGTTDLDQAAIQTLHSFAGALLGERPLDAGLPPSLEVLDEIRAGLLFEEEWQEWLDQALDDEPLKEPLRIALSMGLSVGRLREAALLFHGRYDLVRAVTFPDEPMPQSTVADSLAAAGPELTAWCAFARNGESDQLVGHVRDISRVFDRVTEDTSDPVRVWRLLARSPRITAGNRGNQKDWDDEPGSGTNACKLIKERMNLLQSEVDQELAAVRRAALMPLLRAVRDFVLSYEQKRRSRGQAEFHDLLVWARDLLRHNVDARDYFRGRYSHLLIDEFQDTDPIQAEIALFLAEEVAAGTPEAARPRDWREVQPEGGKLFVVGDPKQSIYRFRHADVTVAVQLREQLGIAPLLLVQNFRSHRPVIEWVNHAFGKWMMEGEGQPAYAALEWRWGGGASEPPAAPGVYYLGGSLPLNAPQVRQREARDIAALMRKIGAGGWAVTEGTEDDGTVRFRPARYSDVCLLAPRRTGLLRDLELALEDAGVPYRLESASLVFETQEVRDLLNCLEAVDNPVDQVAVAAALRSPAFACSDVELLAFLDAGGRLDYLSPGSQAPDGPVLEALRALKAYHDTRRWKPFPLLIEELIRERRLMELALAHPRPREQWRRYQFVIDRARAFAESGGPSLRAFLQWMREQQAERARSVETPVPEGDEDAIRVLTIHGSKGLEFPIVVLADLGGGPSTQSDVVLFDRDSGAVEVRLGDFEMRGYEALRQREAAREAEEQVRLMYVAATRAKDHLVVSSYRGEKSRRTVAETLEGFLSDAEHLWHKMEPGIAQVESEPEAPDDGTSSEDTAGLREEWIARRERLIELRSRPPTVGATTLAREQRDDLGSEEEPWRRGRAGTSVGRAVHAVLQTVDLATGVGLDETARAQAQAEGIPERLGEIETLVRVALESKVVRRAVASGRWWREVPVGVPVGDGVLEGFVDLLFEEDGGLVVVDYKTDALPDPEAVRGKMQDYRLQGGAYALAVQRVTGQPVREAVFLFLKPNVEESVPQLSAVVEEVESTALALLSTVDA